MSENTKIKISDGLIRLIEKENGSRITVTSLIKACGISRQTFYYHFKDMDDVLEWSAARVTDELVRAGRETADMRSAIEIFADSFSEKYSVLKKLMDSAKRSGIEKMIIGSVRTYLEKIIKFKRPDLAVNHTDMDMLLCFDAYGLFGIMMEYCGQPHRDKSALTANIEKIFSGQILLSVLSYTCRNL